jgi:hypothetical protein
MTEGHNPCVAQNQVKRERKDHHHQHLAAEDHPVGEKEKAGDRDQPGQRLRPAHIVAADEEIGRLRARGDGHCAVDLLDLTPGHKTPPV